jgi:SAM-dependent methyltransferase
MKMAHPEQMFFVANVRNYLPDYFRNKKVLEVGSLNINGSVRQYFEGCEYVGIDIAQGRDVDRVGRGEDFGAAAESFDVVITCEMMEHNPEWDRTWLNLLRMLKRDGLLVMTCASAGRRQHGTRRYEPQSSPLQSALENDYYRNLVDGDFLKLVNFDHWFSSWGFFTDHVSHDLDFFALGNSADAAKIHACKALKSAFDQYFHKRNMQGEY